MDVLNLVFSILLAASLAMFLVTAVLTIIGAKKNAAFEECSGKIINFYESTVSGIDGNVSISPVVEYNVYGTRYEFVGGYCSSNMEVGDDVVVLFNPNDPSVATMKSGTIFAPVVTGLLAIGLSIPAIVYFISFS